MPHLEDIEHHTHGRGGERFTRPMPEPLESGDEVFIEDRYLTVEGQGGFGQGENHLGQLTKSLCVIPTILAKELHAPIRLESQNPPPVVFLFVHPSLTMERTGGESGVHEGDARGEGHPLSISR